MLLPGKSHGGGAWWAAVHGVAKSWTRLSDFTFPFHFHTLDEEMVTHSSVLVWRIPGMGSLVGCRLWGHTESNTTEATLAAAAADTLSEIYVNFQLIHLTGLILCLPMQLILYFCIPDVRYNDIIW